MNGRNTQTREAPSPSQLQALILATALLLAAFALRMATLDRLPLHFDEGINVFFGHRSPAEVLSITQTTFDNDPPGHRFALGAWMALAGPSPLAIRLLSVLSGMLMVAVTYRLMREFRLAYATSAVIAGLVALSPYAIEYTQQAKGYALGAAMALVSWWAWVRLFDAGHSNVDVGRARAHRTSTAVAYVASTALALSTHYYVIPLLAMQWVWFAGTRLDVLPASEGRRLRDALRASARAVFQPQALRGLAVQLLACIPIGLLIGLLAGNLFAGMARSSANYQPSSPLELAGRILKAMSIGDAASAGGGDLLTTASAALVTALAIGGAVQLWRHGGETPPAATTGATASLRRRPRSAFWFGASFALLAAGSILLQQWVTFFWPRFLLYALPNLCALIGGLALNLHVRRLTLGAAARAAGLGAYVVLCATGAIAFYQTPIDAQNDYRPLVKAVRPLILKGDAALGTYIWMEGFFTSYAPETRGTLRWYDNPVSAETVDEHMAPIVRSHSRIWPLSFNTSPDAPDNLPVLWLKQHAALAGRFGEGATHILLFDTGNDPTTIHEAGTPAGALFGGRVRLDFTPISGTAGVGSTVPFTLAWSTTRPITEHLTAFVHLVAPDGRIVAQNDGDPVNGLAPSFAWTAGTPVADRRALLIREPQAPGEYALNVGLYRASDGQRLTTETGGDAVQAGAVQIGAVAIPAPMPAP